MQKNALRTGLIVVVVAQMIVVSELKFREIVGIIFDFDNKRLIFLEVWFMWKCIASIVSEPNLAACEQTLLQHVHCSAYSIALTRFGSLMWAIPVSTI